MGQRSVGAGSAEMRWGITQQFSPTDARLLEFEKATEKIKFDIFGSAEFRRMREKLQKRSNGNYLFYSGQTKGFRGTLFYIHKQFANKVTEFKGISERISLIKLAIDRKTKILIIQVYASTLQAKVNETEEFYELLQRTFLKEK